MSLGKSKLGANEPLGASLSVLDHRIHCSTDPFTAGINEAVLSELRTWFPIDSDCSVEAV